MSELDEQLAPELQQVFGLGPPAKPSWRPATEQGVGRGRADADGA